MNICILIALSRVLALGLVSEIQQFLKETPNNNVDILGCKHQIKRGYIGVDQRTRRNICLAYQVQIWAPQYLQRMPNHALKTVILLLDEYKIYSSLVYNVRQKINNVLLIVKKCISQRSYS